MATALERHELAEQPAFRKRVEASMIDYARAIQAEPAPSARRIDLSFQVLRGNDALVTAFSRSIAGFSNGSGKPEIKYDSTDTDIRDAVSFVWDFLAGVRLPTT